MDLERKYWSWITNSPIFRLKIVSYMFLTNGFFLGVYYSFEFHVIFAGFRGGLESTQGASIQVSRPIDCAIDQLMMEHLNFSYSSKPRIALYIKLNTVN